MLWTRFEAGDRQPDRQRESVYVYIDLPQYIVLSTVSLQEETHGVLWARFEGDQRHRERERERGGGRQTDRENQCMFTQTFPSILCCPQSHYKRRRMVCCGPGFKVLTFLSAPTSGPLTLPSRSAPISVSCELSPLCCLLFLSIGTP